MIPVSVLVPTFRRPDSLVRALDSLARQTRAPDEIIVADNAPEAGARRAVESFAGRAPCPVVYVHAANPGVANARNTGFAAARHALIAQLDDDESAGPDWLAQLLAMREATGAAVVFGPVRSEPPAGTGGVRRAWIARLYAREPAIEAGLTVKPFGCGNSLIDWEAASLPLPPFDARANETGGEDDRLFATLGATGARFAWAPEAWVIEHVEAGRASWRHLARRSFAFGQGPSQTAASLGRVHETAAWMGIGLAQAVVFSALAAPALLAGVAHAAACLDRACQGLGKLIWADSLAPRFYGAARLRAEGRSA